MKLNYIYRHPDVGFSIQRVFQTVSQGLKESYRIEETFLPNKKSNIWAMIKNGFSIRKKFNIYHVTGDAHYLLYFIPKKKAVVTVHDIMYYSYLKGFKKKVWKFLYVNVLKRANKVVFISEFAKKQVLDIIDLPQNKYCVIPNPVSPDFKYSRKDKLSNRPIILHIGARLSRKNLANTIKALHGMHCHLRIIGKISDENLRLLKEYKIDYSNVFNLSNEQVVHEYENCDIVNFPSFFEGFGMPIIEGQTVGRPVVTSNLSPMKEVAGKGSCLVDPNNPKDIKNAYEKIINDSVYRKTIIDNGLKNVQKYQLNRIAQQYDNLYKIIIKC